MKIFREPRTMARSSPWSVKCRGHACRFSETQERPADRDAPATKHHCFPGLIASSGEFLRFEVVDRFRWAGRGPQ